MTRYSAEKYFELPVLTSRENLPLINNLIGDRYIVNDDIYLWNGNFWVETNLLDAPDSLLVQTYNLTADNKTVDEGDTIVINLQTTNIESNTTIGWSITGSVTSADIGNVPLTGIFTIINNSAQVQFNVTEDSSTDGDKVLILSLDNDQDSILITIADTSTTPVPTYTLIPSVTTVNEGNSFTVQLATQNVSQGTVLPYTITGIQSEDLEAPGEESLTGSFTIDAVGSSTKQFNIVEDASIGEGNETFTISLNNGLATSAVAINDSSATVPSGSAAFSSPGTFSWTVPEGVTSICGVAIGGGGGGMCSRGTISGTQVTAAGGAGGGLGYFNALSVTPGDTVEIVVGAGGSGGARDAQQSGRTNGQNGSNSLIRYNSVTYAQGNGGNGGKTSTVNGGTYIGGSGTVSGGGGNGGNGYGTSGGWDGGAGGGAGGYSGNGGSGGPNIGSNGSGGGGGGASSDDYQYAGGFSQTGGSGGSTGTLGEGTSGTRGVYDYNLNYGTPQNGGAGSVKTSATYGGGGAGGTMYAYYTAGTRSAGGGSNGAVRIVWGANKSFPDNIV